MIFFTSFTGNDAPVECSLRLPVGKNGSHCSLAILLIKQGLVKLSVTRMENLYSKQNKLLFYFSQLPDLRRPPRMMYQSQD
jgi:hypothetical protein